MENLETFQRLGLALAIGLLMGFERGWDKRELPDGQRVAGIRTFALIGLLGGLCGWFTISHGPLPLLGGFIAVTAIVVATYMARSRINPNVGFTTEIAEFTAFALGALAALGEGEAAAAGGVVAMALLGSKATLHNLVRQIDALELKAAMKLLMISLVLLPVLPDQGYGPGEILNPYKIWLLVVMVAGISFLGYFAIKMAGPKIGSILTAICGGIASSTALTISFAKMGKESPSLQPLLSAGIALANATMFVRLWLIVMVINMEIGWQVAVPLGTMALVGYACTWYLWRQRQDGDQAPQMLLKNPFDLMAAIKFALLLTVVMVASTVLQGYVGEAGLYILATVAGLADVDAVALSMTLAQGIMPAVAATAITMAVFSNTAVKVAWVGFLCGGLMLRKVTLVMALMMMGGLVGLAIGWMGVQI